MIERRIGQRYDLSFPIIINPLSSRGPRLQEGRTRDMSARGVYFTVREDLTVGARVNFVVTLLAEIPGNIEVSVRARGRIVRIDKPQDEHQESTGVAAVIEWYDISRDAASRT